MSWQNVVLITVGVIAGIGVLSVVAYLLFFAWFIKKIK